MKTRLASLSTMASMLNADNFIYNPYGTELPYKDKPLSKKQAKKRAASKKARKARKK